MCLHIAPPPTLHLAYNNVLSLALLPIFEIPVLIITPKTILVVWRTLLSCLIGKKLKQCLNGVPLMRRELEARCRLSLRLWIVTLCSHAIIELLLGNIGTFGNERDILTILTFLPSTWHFALRFRDLLCKVSRAW